jgi:hypothetical protein
VQQVLEERLRRYEGALDDLLQTDVVAFQGMLRERDLGSVVTELR